MKHTYLSHITHVFTLCTFLAFIPAAGHAACYVEYKAKRDNPLKLHYGVAQLDDTECNARAAQRALSPKLASDNWVLLSIVGFVDAEKLDEVKANAGQYFLRY